MTDRKIHWRCFFCGEGFTRAQEKWAAEHFGDVHAKPVCLIRTAGEGALLSALRHAERELRSYRAEDTRILRGMWSMRADHAQALVREEERGYAKGLTDGRAEIAAYIAEFKPRCYPTTEGMARRTAFEEIERFLPAPPALSEGDVTSAGMSAAANTETPPIGEA